MRPKRAVEREFFSSQYLLSAISRKPSCLDGRRDQRLSLKLPLSYAIALDQERFQGYAETEDISGRGAKLRVSHPLPEGSACQFQISLPNHPAPLGINGQVVWSRVDSEVSQVGVSFVMTPDSKIACSEFCQFIATQILERQLAASACRHSPTRQIRVTRRWRHYTVMLFEHAQ